MSKLSCLFVSKHQEQHCSEYDDQIQNQAPVFHVKSIGQNPFSHFDFHVSVITAKSFYLCKSGDSRFYKASDGVAANSWFIIIVHQQHMRARTHH